MRTEAWPDATGHPDGGSQGGRYPRALVFAVKDAGSKGADELMSGDLTNPILNGPYDAPERYFEIGPSGPTGAIKAGRRPSESWIPVPASRKDRGAAAQESLDFDVTGERREQNSLINDVRRALETWRRTYDRVTPITRKLLQHWSDPGRGEERVLFCQREAAETAIFLAEVAGRRNLSGTDWRRRVDEANAVHNAELPRTALKMATGSGKTVVMAMLVAWQTLNHAHSPRDARFTNRFLVVTPGITIRDRLRALLPGDDENCYRLRDLVPPDLWGSLQTAHVFITNYHTFLPRDRREIIESRPRRGRFATRARKLTRSGRPRTTWSPACCVTSARGRAPARPGRRCWCSATRPTTVTRTSRWWPSSTARTARRPKRSRPKRRHARARRPANHAFARCGSTRPDSPASSSEPREATCPTSSTTSPTTLGSAWHFASP